MVFFDKPPWICGGWRACECGRVRVGGAMLGGVIQVKGSVRCVRRSDTKKRQNTSCLHLDSQFPDVARVLFFFSKYEKKFD